LAILVFEIIHQKILLTILFYFNKVKEDYDNRFNDWKSQFMSEKNDLKFKCEDLESKLSRANLKLNEMQKIHEKVVF
jgi:hypothetical protein